MKENTEAKIFKNRTVSDEIHQGEHLDRIVKILEGEENQENLRIDTVRIASRIKYSQDVGLVLGQVQSGKTTSFEAVTGIARDNDTPLVIILAGVSEILTRQTKKRFNQHFLTKNKDWYIVNTLGNLPGNFKSNLEQNLERWDANSRTKKGSIVICMKNHSHIEKLTKELSTNSLKDRIKDLNVLIIDDEADQYSMNTRPDEDPSTTYSVIEDLRSVFNRHTYLQYTATPQAPFLISTLDRLSPDWVERVRPGKGYVGFYDIFGDHSVENNPYCREIPTTDDNEINEMPQSLREALASYLVSAAQLTLLELENDKDHEFWSMLIHPSRLIGSQETFKEWVDDTLITWKKGIKSPESYPDAYKEFQDLIGRAYDDYSDTDKNNVLKDLESIKKEIESDLIYNISVELINSGKKKTASEIDWEETSYRYHIIVAGQAMDRGTTVEGLITTYLSRGSSKQEDTQVQRARFLGYKKSYISMIRVFLDDDSLKRYKNYVATQEDFLNLVDNASSEDKDFKEVRRNWRLNKGAKSCRDNVVSLEGVLVVSGKRLEDNFSYPAKPQKSLWKENNKIIENFLSNYSLEESMFSGKDSASQHSQIILPYKEVYKGLLSELRYQDLHDSENFALIHYWLEWLFFEYEKWDERNLAEMQCLIVKMSDSSDFIRKRALRINGKPWDQKLVGFLQGRNNNYIGDREVKSPDYLTLQIHTFDLYSDVDRSISSENKTRYEGSPLYEGVMVPAIRLPDEIWKKFDLQTQKGNLKVSSIPSEDQED